MVETIKRSCKTKGFSFPAAQGPSGPRGPPGKVGEKGEGVRILPFVHICLWNECLISWGQRRELITFIEEVLMRRIFYRAILYISRGVPSSTNTQDQGGQAHHPRDAHQTPLRDGACTILAMPF